MTTTDRFKIRTRTRRQWSPPPGMRQVWDEVQVVEGRKVVHRCGLESEALAWIARQRGEVAQ